MVAQNPARKAQSGIALGAFLLFAERRNSAAEAQPDKCEDQASLHPSASPVCHCINSLLACAAVLTDIVAHGNADDPERKVRRTAFRRLEEMRQLTLRDPKRLTHGHD